MNCKLKYRLLIIAFCIAGYIGYSQITFNIVFQRPHCNNANDGVINIIITSNNHPYQFSWSTGQTTPLINNLEPNTYTVLVTDNLGNDTLITVPLPEIPCPVVPELVFTPNSDGINDTWTITNLNYYPNFKLVVYNRWGQIVFRKTDDYEPWDGTLIGQPVPSATYYFVLELDSQSKADDNIIKGAVNIVR